MRFTVIVALVVAVMGLPTGASAAIAGPDTPNTTCAVDAAAVPGRVIALVTCLQIDSEQPGDFPASVTVTLQRFGAAGWVDDARETCAATASEGVLALQCAAAATQPPTATVRGLVDLDKPRDWDPIVVDPTHVGGGVPMDALAADECVVDESTESSDLTVSDAPWVDLCAIWMGSQGDATTVTFGVAGLVEERVGSAAWEASLAMKHNDCVHDIAVEDGATIGDVNAKVTTRCGYSNIECTGLEKTVFDLLRMSCSAGSKYEMTETIVLPDAAVTFTPTTVSVTLQPSKVSPFVAKSLAPGKVVSSVAGYSTMGTHLGAQRAVFDVDYAYSTGRSFTIGS